MTLKTADQHNQEHGIQPLVIREADTKKRNTQLAGIERIREGNRKVLHGETAFQLDEQQLVKLQKWIKDEGFGPSRDPLGGGYDYIFSPTNIGTIVKVRRGSKEIDLTDYDGF